MIMTKTIEKEIISYLNENDMYFVEDYDREGFPVNDEALDLIGNMTNAELCDMLIDSMEYIAEVQRKKDIEKACEWLKNMLITQHAATDFTEEALERLKQAMEE